MAPKEHGAWGQILVPLTVGLGLGRLTLPALAYSAAAIALFLAHEPLLVLLGQRGTRAQRTASDRARVRLRLLMTTAVVLGAAALAFSNWQARAGALMGAGGVLVAWFGFLAKGEERTTFGEVWLAGTLPLAAAPVALAADVPLRVVVLVWASFALAYAAGVYGVRGIIHGYRQGRASMGWAGLLLTLVGIGVLCSQDRHAGGAALLFWSAVAACRAARPSPKSPRRVGWLLVATSLLHGIWLLIALRVQA